MNRLLAFIIFIIVVAIVGVSSSVAAATKLVVGYAALNARISPLWLAEEQGYLAKYGLQVEQVYLRGAPTLVAGLASGDIQLGRSGGSAVGAGAALALTLVLGLFAQSWRASPAGDQLEALFGSFSIGWRGYGVAILIALAVSAITGIVSRVTVRRFLN